MGVRMRWLRLAGLAAVLAVSGCSILPGGTPTPTPTELPPVELAAPADGLTLVAESDASAASVAMSRALYSAAPAAVLAPAGDALLPTAASAAVALGVPLLEVGDDDAVQEELERLGAERAVVAGDVEEISGVEFVPLPGSAEDASRALGVRLAACEAEPGLAAVAALDPGQPCLLEAEDAGDASPEPTARLPRIPDAEPATTSVALLVDEPAQLSAAATARAAGVRVVLLPADDPNPQRSEAAISALSAEGTSGVLAVGAAFADDARLDWKVRTARSGWQLPGGGQLLFPNHMLVAIYGTPGAPVLGVLGEQDLGASIERARSHAAPYQALTTRTVVPSFEIISSVASASAGPDGNYSNEIDIATIKPWVEEAGRQGLYVVLDLQPGRTDFATQARQYEELLAYPHVGLALDPEWRIGPDQVHLVQIGNVGADEVNTVIAYLEELTDRLSLPPKLLVLHQFRLDMLPDRERVNLASPAATVLVHADGQGSQPAKQDTWRTLREGSLIQWWGWKNFYDEDAPVLSPEETMAQVVPAPDLVTYQ
ncbi:hypothetical protein [Naasia sp. SYSU D00948]|uniref:hypothetical protein n=1 Tax=Naasia sp. SYSU D00948 TaxID=2817379 RepID=UPI001B309F4B|nr:hypothetical protein [Naasia sp. SYSU D00948]